MKALLGKAVISTALHMAACMMLTVEMRIQTV